MTSKADDFQVEEMLFGGKASRDLDEDEIVLKAFEVLKARAERERA